MFFVPSVAHVLAHEGGWSNHSADPGGATNWGISLRWLRGLDRLSDRNKDGVRDGDANGDGVLDVYDIKDMTQAQAIELYKLYWWDEYHYGDLTQFPVAAKIFDTAVNTGASQAHKIAQRAANQMEAGTKLVVDGVLGPVSRRRLNAVEDVQGLVEKLCAEQARFYQGLVDKDQERKVFLKGWMRRAHWAPAATHHGG